MTPSEFCKGCKHLNCHGSCFHYHKCRKWTAWFREQWHDIRVAAALATPNEVIRDRKLLAIQEYEEKRHMRKGELKDDQGTTQDL